MAKDTSGNPWVFDAAAQGEGQAVAGANFNHPIYVQSVELISGGTGGVVDIRRSSGGVQFAGPVTLIAGDREVLLKECWTKGIYIEALPATCQVLVHHGKN